MRLIDPQGSVCAKVERAKETVEGRVEDKEREGRAIKEERGSWDSDGKEGRVLKHSWLAEGYNDCHIAKH